MTKTHTNIRILFLDTWLTHFSGLYFLQRFFQKIKMRSALTQTIRFRQLNNRYFISDSILAILYPIILGLGWIETNILFQQNGVFQFVASLPIYPDPTTLRRFLERFGSRGLTSFLEKLRYTCDHYARAYPIFGRIRGFYRSMINHYFTKDLLII